ncbi:MAG: prepilin-type N-terminal cleavage/methylation domain-containing protein [Pseudomonadales bacterium]|nr:prepilin-type N-terminal cleavage/methylation domain-containing protein [Pseudomonadales bacterium]MCP5330229.1 prepilin-type N-terminal cleavage/methylation domain-containing protein [Pseudomonadales bacterium]MCP5344154.1 prepilin-type N-terminal cleavage/methylation domain-containing protein [Pseudomonadales bacterium]
MNNSVIQRFPYRGFTLLELMVVLAILAMGTLLLYPNIGSVSARSFTAQVREASSLLNYARRTAVVTGQPTTASFYVDRSDEENAEQFRASTYSTSDERHERWQARGIALAYRDSTDQRQAVEESVDVTFYPEGGSTGGALILSLNAREAVISIDPFSGRVATEYRDD